MADSANRQLDQIQSTMAALPNNERNSIQIGMVVSTLKGVGATEAAASDVGAHAIAGQTQQAARGATAFTAGAVENSSPVSLGAGFEDASINVVIQVTEGNVTDERRQALKQAFLASQPMSSFGWTRLKAGLQYLGRIDPVNAERGRTASPFVEMAAGALFEAGTGLGEQVVEEFVQELSAWVLREGAGEALASTDAASAAADTRLLSNLEWKVAPGREGDVQRRTQLAGRLVLQADREAGENGYC